MIKIIFDTNFLMYAVSYRGDIFQKIVDAVESKIEKIILRPVYNEIQKLSVSGTIKVKRQATRVLEVIRNEKLLFQIIDISLTPICAVDEAIVQYAKKNSGYVATNDKELKKTLRKSGIPVIFIRQRTRIGVIGRVYQSS